MHAAALGVWSWDIPGGRIRLSEQVGRMLPATPPAEVAYEEVLALVHPEDRARVEAAVRQAVRTGKEYELEYRIPQPDGTARWIASRGSCTYDKEGTPLRMTGVSQDVTERKRSELALQESEQRFRTLFEESPLAIGLSREGRILYTNKKYLEMFGYEGVEELRGRPVREQWAPECREELEERSRRRDLGLPVSPEFEGLGLRKDGSHFPVHAFATHVQLADGMASIGFLADVTDHKRAEAALRESEERFRQVAENVADFIWEVDAEGLYRYTSPSVEKILGYRAEELVGKVHFYDLFAPEVRDELKAAALDVFAAKQAFRAFPNPNVSKDGRVVHLETSGAPVLDAAGNLLGYRGADTDVTERKWAALEADRLRRELAHISRVTMMGELTASLAHELNQPLTAIVTNAHAGERYLAAPAPPLEELREILVDVAADAQRAGEVISRLRSLLKKDATRFLPLDLNELIREVVALTQTDAIIRNQPIALALAPDLPPVRGDRVQLQQVLLNLVLNGMEAMEPQAPAARQLCIQTLGAGTGVRVGVQDRGPGVPPDKLETVFDTFFTTKAHGMGLGLAISRSIVEAHGGRIWAENNPERGASFWFSLPVSRDPTP
jgi:PAS domain S-box-containing protein